MGTMLSRLGRGAYHRRRTVQYIQCQAQYNSRSMPTRDFLIEQRCCTRRRLFGLQSPPSLRNFTNSVEGTCWNCTAVLNTDEASCSRCLAIQAPNENCNFFKLLGMKESFDINLQDLTHRFRAKQAQLHPDRHAGKSNVEQIHSSQYSTLLNVAYQTLAHPVERGTYLLKLANVAVKEGEIEFDQEFLLEILDKNESISDSPTADQLRVMSNSNQLSISRFTEELSMAFKKKDYQSAKGLIGKMNYFINLDQKIKEAESKLGVIH